MVFSRVFNLLITAGADILGIHHCYYNHYQFLTITTMKRSFLCLLLLAAVSIGHIQAQYFGRNKPRYQEQDFKVTETEHFSLYNYLENPKRVQELATMAETWYAMHQAVLQDTFKEKNPVIIYNSHAGFQQTNAIDGDISVGTGGVTEALRNRVIFPLAMTNQQTDHVFGHELVHAFQYHMILNGDSTGMRNFANLPLWMVEGLAEYLSIGRVDAHTALWMRDAIINDDLPTIKKLDNYKYFPYRWGQSFWAFVAGTYGDEVIRPLFVSTAKHGFKTAVRQTLFTTEDSLSEAWQTALRTHYGQWVSKGQKEKMPGKKLLYAENSGKMNISPVLSPNGRYVIFMSEKGIFTLDLFLADARTGKILRKVASTASDGHIDQINFIESAGTWSPDSKRFAFDVYEKGRSVLVIKNVFEKGKTEKITLPGVPAFANPAWSPDGKTIVVSGLVNGQTDLYAYDLKTKKVTQLTNTRAAEIQSAWSADGKILAFATDEISLARGRTNGAWTMNLGLLDITSGQVEQLDLFAGADNMNPQFDQAGNLYFLSDRDGFRNLYRYESGSKKVFQLTKLLTGITGITPYAPAITVATGDRDRVLYTHYSKGEYTVYEAQNEEFLHEDVTGAATDLVPATLPPFNPKKRDVVNTNLRLLDNTTKTVGANTHTREVPYKPNFELEYAGGSAGAGVNTGNSSFGTSTGLAGGIDLLFGDILGNNQLFAGLALNGGITDAAGQFSYINQKKRINWGVNLSHIPYRSGQYYQDPDFEPQTETTLDGKRQYLGYQDQILVQRIFQERLGVFASYPFSTVKRFEVGAAYEFYHRRLDRYVNYIDYTGARLGQDKERIPAAGGQNLANVNAAFVGDNSYFGLTAPLKGYRYRLGVEQYLGAYKFSTLLLDGRRYFYLKPVTLAFRGLGYGRFGGNANNTNEVFPLFAGQSYFVRGYTSSVLNEKAPELYEQMSGSKIGIFNAELRLPFTGPRKLSLIKSGFLITDLNLFFDAGIGFFTTSDFNPTDPDPLDGRDPVKHKPLMSTGISMRVNVFGAIVLEPYFALPLSVAKDKRAWTFGLNFVPGW